MLIYLAMKKAILTAFACLIPICNIPNALANPAVPSSQLTGSVTILGYNEFNAYDYEARKIGDYCYTTEGYDDIASGSQVVIKDSMGKIIAIGRLDMGTIAKTDSDGTPYACKFSFLVKNISKSPFYSITIGSRKEINYSWEELQEQQWALDLSLGL